MVLNRTKLLISLTAGAALLAAPAVVLAIQYSQARQSADIGSRFAELYAIGLGVYVIAAIILLHYAYRQVRRLERAALIDPLCGLPNRRALHALVNRNVGPGDELAIALIDLDGLKSINDFHGHAVGDRVVRMCAAILDERCEDSARAFRLGGDEFALVSSGPLAGTILEGVCRRILAQVAEPIRIGDLAFVAGMSIGLARGTAGNDATSSGLLRQADLAAQVSKARGKARLTWFNEDFDRSREAQRQIDVDLRAALAGEELQLHYQPLIDSQTGRIGAVEALLRWERPDGQRIGPDTFIPVAEETGLIEPIGLWVLRQACSDAAQWDGIKVSVNVSVAQLRNTQFPLQLGQILEETGFPPERLELEITETFLVGDPVVAGRNLEMLRDFGVGIVLDDYGTGYASIGFLRRFRFEKLKLDRTLIVDAAGDPATRTVMASSVTMAKALGMQVTAEGIETETQALMARIAGCDQMQGWLYSKAVPADQIAQQLAAQEATADKSIGAVPRQAGSALG